MFANALSEAFRAPMKRFYKFVLKRLIGKFLSKDFDVDQLDIQLSQGSVELQDLSLDVTVLNQVIEGFPFEIISAKVRNIRIDIPFTELYSQACSLKTDGLIIHVMPLIDRHRQDFSFHGQTWLHELNEQLNLDEENMKLYQGLRRMVKQQRYSHFKV